MKEISFKTVFGMSQLADKLVLFIYLFIKMLMCLGKFKNSLKTSFLKSYLE